MLRNLSHLRTKQQHSSSFPTSTKHENSTPKFEIHHSCTIQSQIRPQYQVSGDYPTSLQYFG